MPTSGILINSKWKYFTTNQKCLKKINKIEPVNQCKRGGVPTPVIMPVLTFLRSGTID